MKPDFYPQIFGKNAQITHVMKIRPVGDELIHSPGQRGTERNNQASIRSSNFCAGSQKRIIKAYEKHCPHY